MSFANKAFASIGLLLAFGPTGAEARTGVEIAEIILIPVLVICSGILAGLTLGYLSLDMTSLEVLSRTGTPKQRAQAKKVIPIRKDGHLLLITLLMANMIVNEALPIIADPVLGGGVQAVVVSTVLIIIFAEIIPQSVCSRFGLAIGSTMVTPVRILTYIFYPVSWPVAKLLTYLLGPHAGVVYRRTELKELVAMHAEMGGHGGDLNTDVVTIMGATLDLQVKSVRDAMTPMKDVFQLPITSKLDYETLGQILKAGHSRIPVYEEVAVHNGGDAKEVKRKIIGVLLTKQLILLDPEDATPLRDIPMNQLPTVDENLSLLQILNTFQEGRSHMAIAFRRKPTMNPLTGKMSTGLGTTPEVDAEKAEEEPAHEESMIRSLFHRKRKNSKSSKDSSSDDEADHSDETAHNTAQNEKVDQVAHASQVSVNTLYAIDDEFPVGLITLEDVLEELLGEEIYDETDSVIHEDGTHRTTLQPYIPPEAVGRLGPPPAPSAGAATKGSSTPPTKIGGSGVFGRFGKQMVRSRSAPGKARASSGVESGSGSGSDSKATTPGSVTPSTVLSPGSSTPLTAEPVGMTEPESLTNIAEHSATDNAAGRPSILKRAETAAVPAGPEKAVTIAGPAPTSAGSPPLATGPKVPGLLSDAILLERGRRMLVAEGADPKALPPMRLATPSRPGSRSATPSGGVRVLSVPTPTTAQATAQVSGLMPMSGAAKPGPKGVFKSPALQAPIPVRAQPGQAGVSRTESPGVVGAEAGTSKGGRD